MKAVMLCAFPTEFCTQKLRQEFVCRLRFQSPNSQNECGNIDLKVGTSVKKILGAQDRAAGLYNLAEKLVLHFRLAFLLSLLFRRG